MLHTVVIQQISQHVEIKNYDQYSIIFIGVIIYITLNIYQSQRITSTVMKNIVKFVVSVQLLNAKWIL